MDAPDDLFVEIMSKLRAKEAARVERIALALREPQHPTRYVSRTDYAQSFDEAIEAENQSETGLGTRAHDQEPGDNPPAQNSARIGSLSF